MDPALDELVDAMFGSHRPADIAPCPFTDAELKELEQTGELLVYVPAGMPAQELCDLLEICSNVNFDVEAGMIRSAVADEPHWFLTSASKVPELMGLSGKAACRIYEDEGLHGMDLRRYLCFCAAFRARHGFLPDQTYWTFLLAGTYDRGGVSVVGFDTRGNLSHHGWMRDFQANFAGSRYAVLAPRIEVLPQTEALVRARRGGDGMDHCGRPAAINRPMSLP